MRVNASHKMSLRPLGPGPNAGHKGIMQVQTGGLPLIIIKPNFSLCHCLVSYIYLRMDNFRSTGSHTWAVLEGLTMRPKKLAELEIHKTGPEHGPQ